MVLQNLIVARQDGSSYLMTPDEYVYDGIEEDIQSSQSSPGTPITLSAAYSLYCSELMEMDEAAAELLDNPRWVQCISRMGFRISLVDERILPSAA